MEDYAFGIFNSTTIRIKKLIDKFNEILNQEENKLNKKKIIENAEENIIPDDYAKRIYLEYLEKDRKEFKIGKYMLNIGKDIINIFDIQYKWKKKIWPLWLCPFVGGIGMCDNTYPDLATFIYLSIITIVLTSNLMCFIIDQCSINWNQFIYYASLPLIPFFIATPIVYIKNRYDRLIRFIKNRKLSNYKIEQLKKELDLSLSKRLTNECTLENTIQSTINSLNDKILQYIDEVVDKLEFLNSDDRKPLCLELKTISEEYMRRFKEIQEQSNTSILDLDKDDCFKLERDILSKVVNIELKISEIRQKNIELSEKEQEIGIIDYKIDKYEDESNGLQRKVLRP